MKLKGLAVVCAVMTVSACAHIDEATRAEREYRRLEWEHSFVDYQSRCYQAGGRMVIQAKGPLPRSGIPRRGDLFSCTRPVPKSNGQ